MLTLEQALQHGAAVGVKYYVKNSYDKIVGGTCTEEQALSMKKRFEEEDKQSPSSRRAWIEIRQIPNCGIKRNCRSPRGGRGLKFANTHILHHWF